MIVSILQFTPFKSKVGRRRFQRIIFFTWYLWWGGLNDHHVVGKHSFFIFSLVINDIVWIQNSGISISFLQQMVEIWWRVGPNIYHRFSAWLNIIIIIIMEKISWCNNTKYINKMLKNKKKREKKSRTSKLIIESKE